MAEQQNTNPKPEKPLIHELLLTMLETSEFPSAISGAPGTETMDWEIAVIAATLLREGRLPDDAKPKVEKAAMKSWEEYGENGKNFDLDVQNALKALANEFGFRLPEEPDDDEDKDQKDDD